MPATEFIHRQPLLVKLSSPSKTGLRKNIVIRKLEKNQTRENMEEAQPTSTTTAAAVLATAGSHHSDEGISTAVASESAVDFTVAEVNATAAAANDTAVQGYFYQVCFLPAAKPSGLGTVGVIAVEVVVVGKQSTPPSRATSTRYDSMQLVSPLSAFMCGEAVRS